MPHATTQVSLGSAILVETKRNSAGHVHTGRLIQASSDGSEAAKMGRGQGK